MIASEKKEISCRITRTILLYVREANQGSLGPLLEGLAYDEAYLSDVNNWISHDFLQSLYERMCTILNDAEAVYKMCLASERFQSLGILHRIVGLLGSPKFIYSQAPRYNRLLKLNGDVLIHETGPAWIVLEDCYHDGDQKTRHDCDYTRGILTGIPTIFGLPPAHVEELSCQVSSKKYGRRAWPDNPTYGAKGCLYRVHFGPAVKSRLWQRLFRQPGIYDQAIEDLLAANRTIQEKYNQVMKLAAELDSANKQLTASKAQVEKSKTELETSERMYRLLAENASDIIWTMNLSTMRFDYVSPSVRKIRGYSAEESLDWGIAQSISPQSLEQVQSILAEELAIENQDSADHNRYRTVEMDLLCKDGSLALTEARMTFIRDAQGHAVGVLGVSRDIRERKAAQDALNAEKERLAVTLRSIGDGVITTDRNGTITLINLVAERLTAWDEKEALGQPLQNVFKIVDLPDRRPVENATNRFMAEVSVSRAAKDSLLTNRHGEETLISQSGAPIRDGNNQNIGVVLVFRNVTDQRNLEEEQQKIEKLESLGILAGGIAHDFNNFLSGIIGNLSLVKLKIPPSDRVYHQIQEMEKAALRAKNLTRQLVTFAKGGAPIKRTTELTNLVVEAAEFAARGSNVRCVFDFKDDNLHADIDEGQITQVIHNLILNAVQAMPDGGTIQVNAYIDRLPEENGFELKEGPYVRLTFQDQGSGINAQDLKKIFDPYFTTKHQGSGLGLAVAYAVIDKHDGLITVDSQPGAGTTFHIYLPRVAPADDPMAVEDPPLATGSGRILVMDDEAFIRELAKEMLTTVGYEVGLADSGEEAIAMYKTAFEAGRPFDAVILDLTVPAAMGGQEALKHLLAIDPNVKAIVSSGYSNDPIMADYRAYGFHQAVQKPYRVQDINEALVAALRK